MLKTSEKESHEEYLLRAILTILCVLVLAGTGFAQSCTGSVGDPIVDITFGTGASTIGAALPAGITDLNYLSYDCPNDGQYTIAHKTSNCFNNSWHSFTDHTGDVNGYFMLVNASYAPSDFYVQTIDGLCAGTSFQFAVWITNVCNFKTAIPPKVILTVEKTDGTILGSYSTGEIPVNEVSAEWKQYGFNFTMPSGISSVVLRMHNAAPGGIGNDIALDDITFRPIGPKVGITTTDFAGDSALICIKNQQNITFRSDVEKCYATTAYQWQTSTDGGSTWTDITGANAANYTRTSTAAGKYLYRLSVAQSENISSAICRVVSNPYKVTVYGENVRTISIDKPDGAVCEETSVTFTANTTYAGSAPVFQWMINSQPVPEATDSVYTVSNLASGDRVDCYFISSLTCNDPLTSNTIPVRVLIKARTTVDTSICEGENYEMYNTSGTYTNSFLGSNGCDSIRTLHLVVYPKAHSLFDTTICFGTSYQGLTQSGSYSFMYPSVHGCDSVHTIHLEVLPDINTKPHFDTLLCTGDMITVSPGVYDTYKWQDGSSGSSYRIRRGGSYSVTVGNKCGMATKTIDVQERLCVVNLPSAFTPNADGRNDLFRVVNGYNIGTFHFVIFNRWGQKVFESANPKAGWDGTIGGKRADTGVYLWFCTYADRNKPEEVQNLKGSVVLMR